MKETVENNILDTTTYYTMLGVSEYANKEEINKSYHKKALIYHPDKNSGQDKNFKDIQSAYDILMNNEERRKYNISKGIQNKELTQENKKVLIAFVDFFPKKKKGESTIDYLLKKRKREQERQKK